MKNLKHIKGLDELPKFLTEDWIEQAIKKVDKSQMTSEQRMHYEMMLARNATILQQREDEKKQIAKEVTKEVTKETVKETAKNLKMLGVKIDVIAEATGLTIEEIESL